MADWSNPATYTAVRKADAALGIVDLGAAVAALLAQTTVATVNVATSDLRVALWRTQEYGKLDRLYQSGCRGDYSAYPVLTSKTPTDIFSAISTTVSVITSGATITLDADWSVVLAQINLLVSIGVLAQSTATAIASMRTATTQVWSGLTSGILQTARSSV